MLRLVPRHCCTCFKSVDMHLRPGLEVPVIPSISAEKNELTCHKHKTEKSKLDIWYEPCAELYARLQSDCNFLLTSCLAAGNTLRPERNDQLQKTYRSHKPLLPLHLLPGGLRGSKNRGFGHLTQTSHQGFQVTKERTMRSRSHELAH